MILRFSPVVIGLALTSVGCGKIGSSKGDTVQRTSLATPFEYGVEDAACQDTDSRQLLANQTIETWSGTAFADESVDFSSFSTFSSSSRGLTSSHVSGTAFDLHERTTDTCAVDEYGNASCDSGKPEEISPMRPLMVCQPNGHFGRDSLEGVSLASIANIERMRAKYVTLPNTKKLGQTLLVVMPNIETVINATQASTNKSKSFVYSETDNAAFAAGDDDRLYFIVYPRSREVSAKPGWSDIRLWEVPWVMDHEFSHEIFYTYYTSYKEDAATSDGFDASKIASLEGALKRQQPNWKMDLQMDLGAADAEPTIPGETRKVGLGETLSALNEGFADTFAAYSIGTPKGLFCFDKTRDVTSPTFADGQPKVLTQYVRDKFFASVAEESGDTDLCAVSFQDEHVLGAILSHGIHRILTAGLADASAPSQALQERSLSWLTAFDAERQKKGAPAPEDIWVMAIHAALVTAQGSADSLPQSTCDIVKAVFPLHADQATEGVTCKP